MTVYPRILILTPVKDAAQSLDKYFQGLQKLSYPHDRISIGILEGDSRDNTYTFLSVKADQYKKEFRQITIIKKDFYFQIPEGVPRWANHIQVQRRSVIAKCRNHLLFRCLDDEDWVLWLDVDVIDYPNNVIEQLLAQERDIVHPNCVIETGGKCFDLNAWRDHGKKHMHDLRKEGAMVKLDTVGGTMLLVKADLHRDGLIFPPFPYGLANKKIRKNNFWKGEIETEGFGIMASDMGAQCWGMPHLEIKHQAK